MDICYKIVDAVKKELKLDKLEVKLNPVTSSTRIPLMANGTIDLECGSTTNNADRQKQVSFTNTHFLTASRFVSKKSSKHQLDRRSQGQVGGLDLGHHQHQAAHRSQRRPQPGHQHHSGQGSCRGVPDGRDRSRGGVRDGRYPAREPRRRLEGSRAPTSSPTDAFSKPEPYGIMLRKDDPAFKKVVDAATAALYTERRGPEALRQMVHAEDPAEGAEPQHADRRRS